jgi:hypothetical protein
MTHPHHAAGAGRPGGSPSREPSAEPGAGDGGQDEIPVQQRPPTLLEQLGGISGLVSSVIPVLVFVVVNPLTGLQAAIWGAFGAAVAIGSWRVARSEPLQPAVSGVFGVAIAAAIAYWTGEARGFFLYGIWYSLVAGVAFVISILVRWPLVGVIWSGLNSSGFGWRRYRRARLLYDCATAVWAAFFFARFGVQQWLYSEQETGWLGVARLLMGLPLTAVALLVTIWAVRRANRVTASGTAG